MGDCGPKRLRRRDAIRNRPARPGAHASILRTFSSVVGQLTQLTHFGGESSEDFLDRTDTGHLGCLALLRVVVVHR